MPICFQLTRNNETEASSFAAIDAEMCKHFGWQSDERYYVWGWYDDIGLKLALGWSYEKIALELCQDLAKQTGKEELNNPSPMLDCYLGLIKVLGYLALNFRSQNWREQK